MIGWLRLTVAAARQANDLDLGIEIGKSRESRPIELLSFSRLRSDLDDLKFLLSSLSLSFDDTNEAMETLFFFGKRRCAKVGTSSEVVVDTMAAATLEVFRRCFSDDVLSVGGKLENWPCGKNLASSSS